MKRTYSGISLKRPAPRISSSPLSAVQENLDPNQPHMQLDSTLDIEFSSSPQSNENATVATNNVFTMDTSPAKSRVASKNMIIKGSDGEEDYDDNDEDEAFQQSPSKRLATTNNRVANAVVSNSQSDSDSTLVAATSSSSTSSSTTTTVTTPAVPTPPMKAIKSLSPTLTRRARSNFVIEIAINPERTPPTPILKKTPAAKSPTPKKVDFVRDSDDDDDAELSMPSSSSDIDGDDGIAEPVTKKQAPKTATSVTIKKKLPGMSLPKPSPKLKLTPIKSTPPVKKSVAKGDDDDEGEEEYGDEDEDDDDSAGSEDEYGSKSSKRSRGLMSSSSAGPDLAGRIYGKAQAPVKSTRVSRSGRTPLSTLSSIKLSKRPLVARRTITAGDKAVVPLFKPFKVPTFTDETKAPDPSTLLAPGTFTLGIRKRVAVEGRAAHDYTMEGSIILYDPAWAVLDEAQKQEEEAINASSQSSTTTGEAPAEIPQVMVPKKEKAKAKSIAEMLGLLKPKEVPKVHVVVDPVLARVLRPHQVEGVKFMYKCTTGATMPNAFGCIMADEMGLGKTLQCITLLWTLLKQSPDPGKGSIEKCIICCPSSLVRNWANEIVKWLGKGKIGVMTCDAKGTKDETNKAMERWANARGRMVVNPVLIISYESLRMYSVVLKQTPIGLMLCDEGHRLKNSNSQTFVALNELNVQKRVILSGTPIQNDLSEYFSLLNFANPGLLGSTNEFRKNYELPILRGRDSEASDAEQALSNQKLQELSGVVSKFIIRRTNDILSKYLPTKFEHVVFCKLSQFQLDLYNHFVNSKSIQKLLRGVGSQPLKAINILKKLCNHPDLLNLPDDLEGCEPFMPRDYQPQNSSKKSGSSSRGGGGGVLVQPEFSGKMLVLARMLEKIKKETTDKIVLISNYTQTLDIFEKLCRQNRYGVLRLDGTMTINKRQKLVDRFNDPEGQEFVFLLSSKAGGCGLNLIGANRLILFDPDWNPAADQQALARVWRDGQKKDCFVYRFIATGSIEEKIFQRQSHKQSLSSCVVDEDQDVERHFSQENLRQLFQFNATTQCCDTHETFKCKRCVDGRQKVKAPQVSYGDTSTWNHFKGDHDLMQLPDPLLKAEHDTGDVSFVFQYISH